ncbi:MAG: hypothetical protein AAB195_02290, partial [candidate division NC10 bacterium]
MLRGLRLAVRGLTACLLLSLPLLLARGLLPVPASLLLGTVGALGVLGGFVAGLLRRIDPLDAARLLDGAAPLMPGPELPHQNLPALPRRLDADRHEVGIDHDPHQL